jgi:hypothetical protein
MDLDAGAQKVTRTLINARLTNGVWGGGLEATTWGDHAPTPRTDRLTDSE